MYKLLLVRIRILKLGPSRETNTSKKHRFSYSLNNCLDLLWLAEFHSLLVLFLQDQQISPMVAAILPLYSLERTCMPWAALRPSVYSINREVTAYRNLVSKFWTMDAYSERKNLWWLLLLFSLEHSLDCHWKQIMLVTKREQSRCRLVAMVCSYVPAPAHNCDVRGLVFINKISTFDKLYL